MKKQIPIFLLILLISATTIVAQTSWLDRPLNNWNRANGAVPAAPRATGSSTNSNECRGIVRTPESLVDRSVTRLGWSLFGPAYVYGPVTVVTGMASVDGMCRPNQYNGFVFVGGRFAGILSPIPMDARTDGSMGTIHLMGTSEISADFARYTSSDALCCPSQTSSVTYSISSGTAPLLRATDVSTSQNCKDDTVTTMDNVVSGTVTYRQRIALPRTAVLIVRLVDVSRSDTSATTINEQQIQIEGRQVPIPFDFAYDRSKVNERNRYAVQAEIRDGGRLLFITDTSYPVITQGNPRVVDITVVPVGGGVGVGQGAGIIRGNVSYLQRIALATNSEVRVKLVDSSDPLGTPVSETSISTNGRQVPIPFELRYEPRDINRQRNYELWAEIWTDGRLRFRTESGQRVTFRGNQTEGISLVLTAAAETQPAITGRSLSLSKFGTGSIKIGDRPSGFVINGSVTVRTDGTADVSISTIGASTPFRGRVVFFDETTIRIAVEGSGSADADGEIEVKYSGNRLNSITSNNLRLDGQETVIRF